MSKTTPPLCQRLPTNIQNINQQNINKQKDHPDAGATGRIRSIVEATTASTAIKRNVKVARLAQQTREGKLKALSLMDVLAAWRNAILAHQPTAPVCGFSKIQFFKFKAALTVSGGGVDIPDFFYWVVGEWQNLRTNKFAWLNRKTEMVTPTPSLDVLSRFLNIYLKAYSDWKLEGTSEAPVPVVNTVKRLELELGSAQAIIAKQHQENLFLQQRQHRLNNHFTRNTVVVDDDVDVSEELLEQARKAYDEEI